MVPSLPGYGFSGPTTSPGWDVSRVAHAWAELMDRLGYSRYGAQGGDWGARISPELARVDPAHVAGVHANAFVALPSGDPGEMEGLTPGEQKRLGGLSRWREERSGLRTDPEHPPADARVRAGGLWSEFDRGGHFAALQAPGLLTADIRAFFRGLR